MAPPKTLLRPRWCLLVLLFACSAHAQAPLQAGIDIDIEGAPRGVMQILKAYFEERDLTCAEGRPAWRREVKAVTREALDALGYFAAETKLVMPAAGECVVEIDLGQRAQLVAWHIDFVDAVDADELARVRALIPKVPTAFDPQVYNSIKQTFRATLTDAGYADARFDVAEVDVSLENNHAEVNWRIVVGPRFVIAPLTIRQTVLSDELIRTLIEFEEGDYLVNRRLLETYDNLLSSDYFASVRVSPALDRRVDGKVPVTISATPANQWSYLAGPGFATDSGPRFRAEAEARYLNKAGHRVGFSSLVSPVAGNVKSEYRWPYGNPNHEWYALEARSAYGDTDTANSDIVSLGLRRTARIGRHWAQTSYMDYRWEDYDVSNQEGRSQLLLFGSNFSYTSTIDAARPRWGRSFNIDVRGGSRALGSDNDVFQVRAQAKQIVPFLGRSRILIRAEAAYSWQRDFSELPASLRFFAGGDRSVRGYALDSLGEEDETGDVIGGDRLYVGSVEIDVPVRERWSVALFTDIGTAFFDRPNFSQSIGAGVRWYSPLGPIRIDLAHPMQDSDQAVRLHISLGPDI